MALTKIDDRGLKTPIDLLDNEKIRLGTGNDLEIFHDGGGSIIKDVGTGDLRIGGDGDLLVMNAALSETKAKFSSNGAVELYHDNSKKLETASGGVAITGNVTVTSTIPTIDLVDTNANDDFQIRVNAGNFAINDTTNSINRFLIDSSGTVDISGNLDVGAGLDVTGNLGINVTSPDSPLEVGGTGPSLATIHHTDGGTNDEARLMLGALSSNPPDQRGAGISARNKGAGHDLEIQTSSTHSAGPSTKVIVTAGGQLQIPNDSVGLQLGAGQDLQIFHDGTDDVIHSTGTSLRTRSNLFRANNAANNKVMFRAFSDGAFEAYHNGNKKFETRSDGVTLTGQMVQTSTSARAIACNRQGSAGEMILFDFQGTKCGAINVNTNSTEYATSGSDKSLKKNFELWDENVLNLFKNINPQKFHFNNQEDTEEKFKGFIAQEMVDSFPEAYTKDDNNKYWFNPSGIVVYLMKAIQELEAEVAALKGL